MFYLVHTLTNIQHYLTAIRTGPVATSSALPAVAVPAVYVLHSLGSCPDRLFLDVRRSSEFASATPPSGVPLPALAANQTM